jgi:hypothetical protein
MLIESSDYRAFFAFVLLPTDPFPSFYINIQNCMRWFRSFYVKQSVPGYNPTFQQTWSQNQTDVFSFSYFKYWFPLLILINTLKSLLYYHGEVLTILTFSHHVHTTQIFSVKRMQHTAKQRLLCFSLWSQSKWIDITYYSILKIFVLITNITIFFDFFQQSCAGREKNCIQTLLRKCPCRP